MDIRITDYELPPVYVKDGKECYEDPFRRTLVYVTPEETVRQRILSYLTTALKVPADMIAVEEPLSHYGIDTKRRADIIIHKPNENNKQTPMAVVECKAPDVQLDDNACNQAADYCDMLGADYALITNGNQWFFYHYNEKDQSYYPIEAWPPYEGMLKDEFRIIENGGLPPRIAFGDLKTGYKDYIGIDIGADTPESLAVPILNLWEGLLDTRVKMPVGDYGLFRLLKDCGVKNLTYGNASGGQFSGPYRYFQVETDGVVEFFSISVSTYCTWAHMEIEKTSINVGHDNEKMAHHALQLVVDDNLVRVGDRIDFYHNGRIAVGNKGSGKVDELRMFVADRYPKIIRGNRFYMGSLVHDRLWKLDDPEVTEVIANLISYAIVRDEYREYVKNK